MSNGAGHIMDMNNRLKQNRAQRPSNRKKFKENGRGGIYASTGESQKPNFKTIPEEALKNVKTKIREKALLERKRENRLLVGFIVFMIVAFGTIVMLVN